ncbi:MAG: zinc carboxypeptidase [Rhodocyclales bacterium RIFCSPLOWO2_02_FULL_63_24]|nr:MAG: zinc carboxypeptidase [Rhodocyclales bacterium GWA2_65_19]OHC70066.1 MAG: zinc carboxypeptidase [Rhodocyclales bacterium RIFCSPLOWO2_02_FULL_63_24]
MYPSGFTEQDELERIIEEGAAHLGAQTVCEVTSGERRFPIYAVTLGNPGAKLPAVGFFGGFHGLERIGAEVVLDYLRSLVARLRWDSLLHKQLESVRLVFMPLVNPGGIWRGTRANPNGVDLMRNAPLESAERVPFMIGGQRISAGLPWYRGALNAPMEAESQAVCRVVEEELLAREFSLAVDCHSGFGIRDRIWFPYAHTALPIEHLAEIHSLKSIYDETYANHNYLFEPQSRQYLAHGDLWDYLYLRATASPGRIFLPLTLEMGSWLWVKKNPRQLFSRHGIFNPLIEHRQQRVLRRHLSWLDFLTRAASGYRRWLPTGTEREQRREAALALWYRGTRA